MTTTGSGGAGLRDLYEVLGVPPGSDRDEIRRAYRALALECHPDRNQGSAEAEERFKELAHAFRTLSDPEQRSLYDRFGHQGLGRRNGLGPDLAQALDVFVQQFRAFVRDELGQGDAAGNGGAGGVLCLNVAVSLAEVVTGASRTVPLPCPRCSGTGREEPSAAGTACSICAGTGADPSGTSVRVNVPPGVATGDLLPTFAAGGRRANVMARVEVEEDPRFVRAGSDLVLELALPGGRGATAAWQIPTPTGTATVQAPAHASPGGVVRFPGLGLPSRRGATRGDLLVKLVGAGAGEAPRRAGAGGDPAGATGRRGGQAAAGLLASARGILGRARHSVEGRISRFLDRERRHARLAEAVRLARSRREVESSERREIESLSRLEAELRAGVRRLEEVQLPASLCSSHGASLAAEAGAEAREGRMAVLVLFALSVGLAVLNVMALGSVLALLVPDPSVFVFPLLVEVDLPLLVTAGAFASGVLAQALGAGGAGGAVRGTRGGGPGPAPGRPALAKAGPYAMAAAAITVQALLFSALARAIDLHGLLGLSPDVGLSVIATAVVPLAGVAIPMGLMSLGAGFWYHLRRVLRSGASAGLRTRLARHLRRLRALPETTESLQGRLLEAQVALDALGGRISETLARARDAAAAGEASEGIAGAHRRSGASENIGAHARSTDEVLADLAVGVGVFALFVLLVALVQGRLAAGLDGVPGIGSGRAVELAALAGALAFPVLAHLSSRTPSGSESSGGSPLRRPGALAGALLVVAMTGMAWLALTGPSASDPGPALSLALLPATGAVVLSLDLGRWVVAAGKGGYLAALALGWVGLVSGQALLGAGGTGGSGTGERARPTPATPR